MPFFVPALLSSSVARGSEPPIISEDGVPLLRLSPVAYDDGISTPRTLGENGELPSARLISNLVCAQSEVKPSFKALSAMVFQWGQFVDHDITLAEGAGEESFDIEVPLGDPDFDPFNTGTVVISLSRAGGEGSPREQVNHITPLIDGSVVYGSDSERIEALRSHVGGRLRTSSGPDGDLLPFNSATEPLENANANPFLANEDLFLAGDVRANEQTALTAMHTLFVREHNRLADEIAVANPTFSDEEIYCEARRWLTAFVQAITFNEFLPAVLGADAIAPYAGYDSTVDANVINEFAVAAYRVGHTMLPPVLHRLDDSFEEIAEGHLALADAFFVPDTISDFGIEPYLRGLASIPQQATDNEVVDDIRNFLFGAPGSGGFDLASLNIQRGRDHGVSAYNDVRVALGLTSLTNFSEITSDGDLQSSLSTAYDGTLNDIDLWIGGMAEDEVEDSILGETFQALWVNQFTRLRDGDPDWYLNQDATTHSAPFTNIELALIEETTLADIISRNTSIEFDREGLFQLAPPTIEEFSFDSEANTVSLTWTSYLNAEYEVLASRDLEETFVPVFEELGQDGETTMNFPDESLDGEKKMFFRVVQK